MTREYIKSRFLAEAIEHGKAVAIGDHKKANKLHKKLQALYNQAKDQSQTEVWRWLVS